MPVPNPDPGIPGTPVDPASAAGSLIDLATETAGTLQAAKLGAHESAHISGGSDPFLSADLLEAVVKRLQTTTGPADLVLGAWAETEALVRGPGNTMVGSPRIAANLFLQARNESGSAIALGVAVAAVGFDTGTSRILIDVADKDTPTRRPAVGMTTEAVGDNANTDLLLSVGSLSGIDTSSFTINDQLVLGDDGALSRPPPDVDPFTGEIQLIGSVTRVHATLGEVFVTLGSGLLPTTAAQFFATHELTPTGLISGGEVTRATGLLVDVSAGTGFINVGGSLFRTTWSAVTNLALTASDTNYIFVDETDVVQVSLTPPSGENDIRLADAITDGSSIILLANHKVLLEERPPKFHTYAMDVVGNVVVSGLVTTKDAIAYRLQVDAGTYYTRDCKVTVPATDPIAFTHWYRNGSGGWTHVAASTLIDQNNWDDGTGTLNSLIAGEWKKDLLFVVHVSAGVVEYHVFYGQETFASQAAAEGGAVPAADSDVIANAVRSGGVVIEGAAAAIASVVDERPFIGQLAPGTTAVSDHGLLAGLGDDDHTHYLLADGTRAMTGDLAMGTNDIAGATFISIGPSPALSGALRLENHGHISARNSGDTGDLTLAEALVQNTRETAVIGNTPNLDVQVQNQTGARLGFFGISPAVRASSTDDIKDMLTLHGLLPGTDATPLDLDGGTLEAGSVGIGGTPVASAALEVVSTTRGILPSRMTTTQRDAISSPATGLVIFNTTTARLEFYNGTAWGAVSPDSHGYYLPFGGNLGVATELARVHGHASASPTTTVGARVEAAVPKPGTAKVFTGNTELGDGTTVYEILLNSVVAATRTPGAPPFDDSGISIVVVAGDVLAVRYSSGTAPARGTYGLFIEQ